MAAGGLPDLRRADLWTRGRLPERVWALARTAASAPKPPARGPAGVQRPVTAPTRGTQPTARAGLRRFDRPLGQRHSRHLRRQDVDLRSGNGGEPPRLGAVAAAG